MPFGIYAGSSRGCRTGKSATADRLGRFAEYCRIRFAYDPHLFAAALSEEVGDRAR